MDEKQKGGFQPSKITDDFQKHTKETRSRLERATEKDALLAEVVTSHAEAVNGALIALTTFCKRSRPADSSEIRKYMRAEVDAVWDIQEIMDGDIAIIRRLGPGIEAAMSSKLKEDWTLTLNQVDTAIEASLDVVRAAWDDLSDNSRTSTERVTARGAAIKTLDNLGKQ
jgi:hypothetical protein